MFSYLLMGDPERCSQIEQTGKKQVVPCTANTKRYWMNYDVLLYCSTALLFLFKLCYKLNPPFDSVQSPALISSLGTP